MTDLHLQPDLRRLRAEWEQEVAAIANWWHTHALIAGKGLHGEIDLRGSPVDKAPRCIILVARVLWFFSRMAIARPDPRWRAAALDLFTYLATHFVDAEHGGVVWEVADTGAVLNGRKQAYAQAFAIYALSACARATGNPQALELAITLYETLENRFRDMRHDGYFEAFANDWSPLADVRLSDKDDPAPRSMNTHLHILEACSELFTVWPSAACRRTVVNLIDLHHHRIFDADRRHLRLFWSDDWQDCSRFVSFGHDIEASWLVCEAAQRIGASDLIARSHAFALTLVDSVQSDALGPLGEIYNERSLATGDVDMSRIWWVQAEAMVGYAHAFQITGDARHVRTVGKLWDFIKAHIRDRKLGEWRWFSDLDPDRTSPYAAGAWKACYHNGRALLECLDRLKPHVTHP